MKVTKKSQKEIKLLREGGKILAEALYASAELAKEAPDRKISTQDLSDLAEKIIREHNGEPSFLNYANGGERPFPGAMCTSIDDEIVHGVPNPKRVVKEGDLLKLDLGVKYKELYTDSAITIPIGKVTKVAYELIEATSRCLEIGLEQVYPGSSLGNFGSAVDKYAKKKGFVTVKRLVGHGVGYAVHEPPQIPNFGRSGEGSRLKKGMVIALEPMLNEGSDEISLDIDGFTFKTEDGKLSAHFEHTVAVTDEGCEILTKP